MNLQLNAALDPTALAATYQRRLRIQVPDFLEPASAERLHGWLHDLPWGLVYNEGAGVVQLDQRAVAQLQPRDAALIMEGIRQRARAGYQFLYAYYPLLNAYFAPDAPRLPIFEAFELMNSEPVLRLVRQMTGLPNIRWADGQATWFKPGHFLKSHTDQADTEGRLAAYVLNMSPDWDLDGGGFLQFFDESKNIEQAFRPVFNTLNLFTIPQLHSVSMVSTFMTVRRMAITGWFRSDTPPGPIPFPR
ncbi:MAG TPA: 2OG-Fe(II) oxygenase family protein [Sphingomicrobium sp.]|jgi:SM-20-related protein|nr:2OG-Fe(II) oxygenase family protein [Sphingomicrobium sp.]